LSPLRLEARFLLYCDICGHQVHERAPACPGCGTTLRNLLQAPTTHGMRREATSQAMGEHECENCGRHWGGGRSCQFCGQIDGLERGLTIASPLKRLAGLLLDGTPIWLFVVAVRVMVVTLPFTSLDGNVPSAFFDAIFATPARALFFLTL